MATLSGEPIRPPADAGAANTRLHERDLELVERILAGDVTAWNAFVERYTGLMLAMIRRYLRYGDRDDVRTVFVNVLDSLHRSRLRTYQGRAALATWLTLVARSEAMDHLKRRFGRDLKLKALDRLTPEQRTLFRLHYIEGRGPREIAARMNDAGWSYDRFIATLHAIERRLGSRWLKRLSYDLHAQSTGAASGRLLEYLDHVRDEFERHAGVYRPEYYLMEREARRTAEQLRTALAALDPQDRRMLELRFERGWSAQRIADELGVPRRRTVYSTIERVIAQLRRHLPRRDPDPS